MIQIKCSCFVNEVSFILWILLIYGYSFIKESLPVIVFFVWEDIFRQEMNHRRVNFFLLSFPNCFVRQSNEISVKDWTFYCYINWLIIQSIFIFSTLLVICMKGSYVYSGEVGENCWDNNIPMKTIPPLATWMTINNFSTWVKCHRLEL